MFDERAIFGMVVAWTKRLLCHCMIDTADICGGLPQGSLHLLLVHGFMPGSV